MRRNYDKKSRTAIERVPSRDIDMAYAVRSSARTFSSVSAAREKTPEWLVMLADKPGVVSESIPPHCSCLCFMPVVNTIDHCYSSSIG